MGLSRSITVYFDKMVRATRGPAPLHQLRTADTEKTVAIVAHGCASQAMASVRVVINIHALHMRQCKLISKLHILHKLSLGLRDQIAQRHPNKIRKCHTPHPFSSFFFLSFSSSASFSFSSSVSFRRIKTSKDSTHRARQRRRAFRCILIWNNIASSQRILSHPHRGVFKCVMGICRSHHLGKVVACICSPAAAAAATPPSSCRFPSLPPSNWKWQTTQAEVSSLPPSAAMQPHSELSAWLYISRTGGPKERRCPAGDRPLNTSSVLLPHICQYTHHLSQRLPQNQSVSPSLRCFPLEIQQMASFSFSLSVCLSACLSSLWSANYIPFKLLLILSFFLPSFLSFFLSSCTVVLLRLILPVLATGSATHLPTFHACGSSLHTKSYLSSLCRLVDQLCFFFFVADDQT